MKDQRRECGLSFVWRGRTSDTMCEICDDWHDFWRVCGIAHGTMAAGVSTISHHPFTSESLLYFCLLSSINISMFRISYLHVQPIMFVITFFPARGLVFRVWLFPGFRSLCPRVLKSMLSPHRPPPSELTAGRMIGSPHLLSCVRGTRVAHSARGQFVLMAGILAGCGHRSWRLAQTWKFLSDTRSLSSENCCHRQAQLSGPTDNFMDLC